MGVKRWGAAVCGVVVLVALVGCGAAPWSVQSEPDGVTPSSSPSPERTFADGVPATTPSPTASSDPVVNELARGSLTREVQAGSVTADVTYWSELPMNEWTAATAKPLSLSLSTTVTPDDGQRVYLQRVTLSVVPNAGEPLADQDDTSTEDPGYLVGDPYSYSQVFSIGAVPDGTTSITVQLRYEFLVQTTPTSTEYAKQTATDTLTIAIAG